MEKKIHFAPVNLGYAIDNMLCEKTISFMEKRSQEELGINILGNIAIGKEYTTNQNTIVIDEKINLKIWDNYIHRISSKSTIPGIQIAAMPNELSPQKQWITHNYAQEINRLKSIINKYNHSELIKLFAKFEKSIKIAKDIGFKYIEIHAAHGYFLSLLTNEFISGEKKVKTTLNWLTELNLNKDLSIRTSLTDGNSQQICIPEQYLKMNFEYISISNGYYTINKKAIYPQKNIFFEDIVNYAINHRDQKFMIAGNIRENQLKNYWQYPNIHFAIARPLIADPQFANKFIQGRDSEIIPCTFQGKCHHFSNSSTGGLTCPKWEH